MPQAGDVDLRQRVASVIRSTAPFALCPTCLALKLDEPEASGRRAMLLLVAVPFVAEGLARGAEVAEFAVTTRECYGCRRATKLLALRNY